MASTELEEGQERRVKAINVIKELLAERSELLSNYYQLSTFKESESNGSMNQQATSFCQILMDYAALGHFEIFERISDGNERRKAVLKMAKSAYPLIEKSTNAFVDFNDKYAGHQEIELRNLISDVSSLGPMLEERFEHEDQLVKSMQLMATTA